MAKYTVTYKCGHTAQVELFGKEKDRQYRIASMQSDDCPACRATKAAEMDKANGLPALTGSDKQIAWAASIRTAKLADLKITSDKAAQMLSSLEGVDMAARINDVMAKSGKTRDEVEAILAKTIDQYKAEISSYEAAKKQISASWWIEHR